MDKRPNIKKRIALELFRSIKKNRAKLHELRTTLFGGWLLFFAGDFTSA